MYSAFRIILVCFVLNSAVYVDKVREFQCNIIYIKIVLSNNFILKICDRIVSRPPWETQAQGFFLPFFLPLRLSSDDWPPWRSERDGCGGMSFPSV